MRHGAARIVEAANERISPLAGHGVSIPADVPDSSGDGELLSELNLQADEIKRGSFKEIGISGTPTLILTDSNGKVLNIWAGLLNSSQEAEVLGALSKPIEVRYISAAELKKAMDDRQKIVIVD